MHIEYVEFSKSNHKQRIFLEENSLEQIWQLYKNNGCLFITPDRLSEDYFIEFSKKFTKQFANDAYRRSFTTTDGLKVRAVDEDLSRHDLHSEASFSPSWPKILWFYAKALDEALPAATTIADGVEIWKRLKTSTKQFFLQNQVVYDCSVQIAEPNLKSISREIPYILEEPGCYQSTFNPAEGMFRFKQKRYCVAHTYSGELTFVNHAFHFPPDPQILSVEFEGKVEIKQLAFIKEEVLQVYEQCTVEHNWDQKTFIMLDNRRMMHGRRPIPFNSKRNLLILQTLRNTRN
jgi:alpha-ketoglutarate-dependent taurine dioxygenase